MQSVQVPQQAVMLCRCPYCGCLAQDGACVRPPEYGGSLGQCGSCTRLFVLPYAAVVVGNLLQWVQCQHAQQVHQQAQQSQLHDLQMQLHMHAQYMHAASAAHVSAVVPGRGPGARASSPNTTAPVSCAAPVLCAAPVHNTADSGAAGGVARGNGSRGRAKGMGERNASKGSGADKVRAAECEADAKVRAAQVAAVDSARDAEAGPKAAVVQAQDAATHAEAKARQAEDAVTHAEAKVRQAEDAAKQAEAKARQAEDAAKQAEAKARQAEGAAKQAEAKAQQAEDAAKRAEAKAEARIQEVETATRARIQEVETATQARIKEAEAAAQVQWKEECEVMRARHRTELASASESALLLARQEVAEKLADELGKACAARDAVITDMRHAAQAEAAAVEKVHVQQVVALGKRHAAEMETLGKAHAARGAALEKAHAAKLAAAEHVHVAKLASVEKAHAAKLESVEKAYMAKLESVEKAHAEALVQALADARRPACAAEEEQAVAVDKGPVAAAEKGPANRRVGKAAVPQRSGKTDCTDDDVLLEQVLLESARARALRGCDTLAQALQDVAARASAIIRFVPATKEANVIPKTETSHDLNTAAQHTRDIDAKAKTFASANASANGSADAADERRTDAARNGVKTKASKTKAKGGLAGGTGTRTGGKKGCTESSAAHDRLFAFFDSKPDEKPEHSFVCNMGRCVETLTRLAEEVLEWVDAARTHVECLYRSYLTVMHELGTIARMVDPALHDDDEEDDGDDAVDVAQIAPALHTYLVNLRMHLHMYEQVIDELHGSTVLTGATDDGKDDGQDDGQDEEKKTDMYDEVCEFRAAMLKPCTDTAEPVFHTAFPGRRVARSASCAGAGARAALHVCGAPGAGGACARASGAPGAGKAGLSQNVFESRLFEKTQRMWLFAAEHKFMVANLRHCGSFTCPYVLDKAAELLRVALEVYRALVDLATDVLGSDRSANGSGNSAVYEAWTSWAIILAGDNVWLFRRIAAVLHAGLPGTLAVCGPDDAAAPMGTRSWERMRAAVRLADPWTKREQWRHVLEDHGGSPFLVLDHVARLACEDAGTVRATSLLLRDALCIACAADAQVGFAIRTMSPQTSARATACAGVYASCGVIDDRAVRCAEACACIPSRRRVPQSHTAGGCADTDAGVQPETHESECGPGPGTTSGSGTTSGPGTVPGPTAVAGVPGGLVASKASVTLGPTWTSTIGMRRLAEMWRGKFVSLMASCAPAIFHLPDDEAAQKSHTRAVRTEFSALGQVLAACSVKCLDHAVEHLGARPSLVGTRGGTSHEEPAAQVHAPPAQEYVASAESGTVTATGSAKGGLGSGAGQSAEAGPRQGPKRRKGRGKRP